MALPELVTRDLGGLSKYACAMDLSVLDADGVVDAGVVSEVDSAIRGDVEKKLDDWSMPSGLLVANDQRNKWRVVSCLQKAIRHGDVSMAMNAAHAASFLDMGYLYRRLGICAIEDVGVGNLPAVAAVLAALGSKPWRERMGSIRLAVWLARLLAEGVKDRLACELCVWVDFDKSMADEKLDWARQSNDTLVSIAQDRSRDLGLRMLAAWLLAGTKKFWGMTVPKDNDRPRTRLMRLMVEEGMPVILFYVAEMVAKRLSEGMFVSLYLINELLQKTETCTVREFQVPPTTMVGPLNSAGYDMHTREGKIALSKFLKECPEVSRFFEYIPDREMRSLLIGCGVFCAEGGVLAKRLTYDGAEAVYDTAHRVELEYPGLPAAKHAAFLQAIRDNLGVLNECRRKVVWAVNKERIAGA